MPTWAWLSIGFVAGFVAFVPAYCLVYHANHAIQQWVWKRQYAAEDRKKAEKRKERAA